MQLTQPQPLSLNHSQIRLDHVEKARHCEMVSLAVVATGRGLTDARYELGTLASACCWTSSTRDEIPSFVNTCLRCVPTVYGDT